MQVRLINHTADAVNTLIYTKQTRLELGKDTQEKVLAMTEEQKMEELDYMSKTIPSSWEFVDYTFEITGVSRAFTHQFVRNRQGTYAQQTMRMLNMKGFDYVVSPAIRENDEAHKIYYETMKNIQEGYDKLVSLGIPEEDARGVLPTNICTNIIAKYNLRTMADLAKSRTGYRTQNEYREVFEKMIEAVLEVHPWAEKFLIPHKIEAAMKMDTILNGLELEKDTLIDARKQLDILRKG